MKPPFIPPEIDFTREQNGPSNFDRRVDELHSEPAGGGKIEHPFQIYKSSADVVVRYGTVMDIEPANVGDALSLSNGTNTVYLRVTLDADGLITAAEILSSTGGQPADDTDFAHITLGTVVVVDDVVTEINQAATHSLRFTTCGRVKNEEDPPVVTTPGTYHFWGF